MTSLAKSRLTPLVYHFALDSLLTVSAVDATTLLASVRSQRWIPKNVCLMTVVCTLRVSRLITYWGYRVGTPLARYGTGLRR